MRYALRAGLFWLLLVSFFLSAGAIIIPALDLAMLTQESSHIVVGRVITVRDVGQTNIFIQGRPFSARSQIAEIQVARSLKGEITGNVISFQLVQPDVFLGYGSVWANQVGMFFLKRGAGIALIVTNPYYPSVVAALEAPESSNGDLNNVISEVVNVITSQRASTPDKIKAVAVLDRVKTPVATNALRKAADSSHEDLSIYAIAALLERNDISKLSTAENVLANTSAIADPNLLTKLAFALEGVHNPQAIPSLARLLNPNFLQARRSAASALRSTGDNAALEHLAKALYDSDKRVRYQAVMGLAEITEQYSWGPAVMLYDKDEQRYLEHWRDWARQLKAR
jgi:HEAT repeat protein